MCLRAAAATSATVVAPTTTIAAAFAVVAIVREIYGSTHKTLITPCALWEPMIKWDIFHAHTGSIQRARLLLRNAVYFLLKFAATV